MIRITAAGALLCAAAALAACGSSDDTATSTAASAGPAKELKFELTDAGCTPAARAMSSRVTGTAGKAASFGRLRRRPGARRRQRTRSTVPPSALMTAPVK